MSDHSESDSHGDGKHGIARRLMESSMLAEREGRAEEAERLMDEALRTDPQAVEDALLETHEGLD